jgi:hypothetical protein
LLCQHLEISEFGTYSVDMGGKVQLMTLQKCAQCGKYLTLDGSEMTSERILGRAASTKARMRTITLHLNDDVYEKLQSVLAREVGSSTDTTKLISEIIALGLKDYDRRMKR